MPTPPESPRSDIARQLLQQLEQDFLADLPQRVLAIESLVLKLERSENRSESFEELYRHVHSLKGAGGTFGVHVITRICHELENHLYSIEKNLTRIEQSFVDQCLSYLDLINQAEALVHDNKADLSHIDQALEQLRHKDTIATLSGLICVGSDLMTMICRDAFAELPVQLHFAASGLDALTRLLQENYDFTLLGKELAQLNGTAITYALRASGPAQQQTQIIIITTNDSTAFIPELAPDFIIQKDLQISQKIKAAVTQILERKAKRGVTALTSR